MLKKQKDLTYALVAEFDTPDQLLAAANATRQRGYRKLDAFTPFPVHGMSEAIGFEDQKVPWIVFLGGVTGACAGYALQYYTMVLDYPMNVGGKPPNSIPMFVPITFELTILFASFGAVLGMLALNRLPQPYHPVFNTPNFERASQDKFFLAVEANDEMFDVDETSRFLEGLGANSVSLVKESADAVGELE